MKTLQDLFLDELADMYDAETRMTMALQRMAKTANQVELSDVFQAHYRETEGQIEKLEQVFDAFGAEARRNKCEATVGLLEEEDKVIAENTGSPTIDAALIAAGQKVEHYEIASYGCLCEWARLLGNEQAVDLLETILAEEKAADSRLTLLALCCCNDYANQKAVETSGNMLGP
jgi:ferritin-like metal-binding protein YciE